MAVLELRGLRKRYGEQEVVRGLDITVERGECFAFLGPNGAGKTTTLRLALGLTVADGGSVMLLGHTLPRQAREARHQVGVVPQFDNLDPDFTLAENLLVYGRYFGLSDRAIRARIPELLDFAGLAGRAEAPVASLSGGMKRRLTLARALINDPALIFLDEPTTGLDPQARHLIWERLRQLLSQGKTLLLTTHFMEEAERLASRLAVIDQGRLIAEGPPRALIEQHIEPQVVEVFGEQVEEWASQHGSRLSQRCERSGETVFCYGEELDEVVADLKKRPALRHLHRPANLEDVFLKLTGRELRD
ncbi:ATP-binding cassette domain-containing protein [Chitinimonas lacunae]|uniref:ATP-binding cassette domain-containing protein n=1 Tax=Chitinimonas lacunae TaxID=1963018 RepID=A0ABV8MW52_9NEIS